MKGLEFLHLICRASLRHFSPEKTDGRLENPPAWACIWQKKFAASWAMNWRFLRFKEKGRPSLFCSSTKILQHRRKTMTVVKIDEVTKVYEGKVAHRAVNQLSFTVEKGEFLAVMGPSGSGKTTLLNLISTIDSLTSGEILIDGINPHLLGKNELALFRRRELGFVFQDFNLLQM